MKTIQSLLNGLVVETCMDAATKTPVLITTVALLLFLHATVLAAPDNPAEPPSLAANASSLVKPDVTEPKPAATENKKPADPKAKKDGNRLSVTNSTPVLIAAVKKGEAHGLLVGPGAEKLKAQYKTESPLLIDAVVISKLDRKDCKLLSITLSQTGAIGPVTKKPEDMTNTAQIAICEDGSLYKPLPAKPAKAKEKTPRKTAPEAKATEAKK